MLPEQVLLEVISGRRRGWRATSLRAALAAAEPLYAAGTWARNQLYELGIWRGQSPGAPVVSVGNLTTGGTGKTPVVAAVVHALQRHQRQPGIASRGYRALDAAGNDEKRVLDLLCPGVPHLQNRDRVSAARDLAARGVEVVVLDDGFQHRQLARDLDIVLIDATNPWGYGRQLPRGLLRESPDGLSRAGLVVVTRADLATATERERILAAIRRQTAAPVVVSRFIPHGLRDATGQLHPGDDWRGRRVVGFCGIGNPEAFRATLERMGVELASHSVSAFADHHHYTRDDRDRLLAEADAAHAAGLLCTLKDLVKFPVAETRLPILAVDIAFDVIDGRDAWDAAVAHVASLAGGTSR